MIMHIGGPKGVGKTTIANQLTERCPQYTILTVSDELGRLSERQFGKKWSFLDDQQKRGARTDLCSEIVKMSGVVILDSHYIDLLNGKPISVFPEELAASVDIFAVMVCTPEAILQRRILDGRTRTLSLDEIVKETEAERKAAYNLATHNGHARFWQIENRQAADTILEIQTFLYGKGENNEGILRHRER